MEDWWHRCRACIRPAWRVLCPVAAARFPKVVLVRVQVRLLTVPGKPEYGSDDAYRGGTMRRIKFRVCVAVLVISVLQGCATMHGIGEDVQSLGRAIKRAFGG